MLPTLASGVAVRSGARKPEIGNADAFKEALLKARSIASIPESATGYSIAKVFDRLGIHRANEGEDEGATRTLHKSSRWLPMAKSNWAYS